MHGFFSDKFTKSTLGCVVSFSLGGLGQPTLNILYTDPTLQFFGFCAVIVMYCICVLKV